MADTPRPLEPPPTSKSEEALQALEKKLDRERDERNEERFVWIAVTTILTTILFLHDTQSEFLPLAVVLLELPLLFWVAKKMGVESVAQLFDRLISEVGRSKDQG